ncbi:MAG: uroporphyrinogen decarboxylase, partial [Acidobacteria bacterium]|nr:uroporphyrinogen decarboxylase [Acidobacteriota bacterium]
GEYMKEDEYDLFLNDTSDFIVRRYLPRVYGIMEPTSKLPPLNTMMMFLPFQNIASPDFAGMLENLIRVSREAVEWQKETASMVEELVELGFFIRQPFFMVGAPFDAISDFLRGMRGTMLDMYRRPEKVKAACETMCRIQLEWLARAPRPKEFTPAFMALHRGAHGFMSLKQFETYYWPYLLKVIKAVVDAGYTPDIFFEGDYNSRLEYLTEMPHGKVIARFDQIDMKKAKEILGGKICIAGNMPVSLLQIGTPEDVKKKVKELVDIAGRDGGYIMAPASALDEVKPENLKTMIDYTKEYGRYR